MFCSLYHTLSPTCHLFVSWVRGALAPQDACFALCITLVSRLSLVCLPSVFSNFSSTCLGDASGRMLCFLSPIQLQFPWPHKILKAIAIYLCLLYSILRFHDLWYSTQHLWDPNYTAPMLRSANQLTFSKREPTQYPFKKNVFQFAKQWVGNASCFCQDSAWFFVIKHMSGQDAEKDWVSIIRCIFEHLLTKMLRQHARRLPLGCSTTTYNGALIVVNSKKGCIYPL